ncbi:MAG: hypothetical protein ACRC35_14285 [Angustibacter sp.]
MTLLDLRRATIDRTPVYAVVGAADLVVQKARQASEAAAEVAVEQVERARADLDLRALQQRAQHVPARAVQRGLELAGRADETYSELATRGAELVERVRRQPATRDLVRQGRATVSRSRAVMTHLRRTAGDTRSAVSTTVRTVRHEGQQVAGQALKTPGVTTGRATRVRSAGQPAARRAATARSSAAPHAAGTTRRATKTSASPRKATAATTRARRSAASVRD